MCKCVGTICPWRPEDPLELELQIVVSQPAWVLGILPRPCRRAASALDFSCPRPSKCKHFKRSLWEDGVQKREEILLDILVILLAKCHSCQSARTQCFREKGRINGQELLPQECTGPQAKACHASAGRSMSCDSLWEWPASSMWNEIVKLDMTFDPAVSFLIGHITRVGVKNQVCFLCGEKLKLV